MKLDVERCRGRNRSHMSKPHLPFFFFFGGAKSQKLKYEKEGKRQQRKYKSQNKRRLDFTLIHTFFSLTHSSVYSAPAVYWKIYQRDTWIPKMNRL